MRTIRMNYQYKMASNQEWRMQIVAQSSQWWSNYPWTSTYWIKNWRQAATSKSSFIICKKFLTKREEWLKNNTTTTGQATADSLFSPCLCHLRMKSGNGLWKRPQVVSSSSKITIIKCYYLPTKGLPNWWSKIVWITKGKWNSKVCDNSRSERNRERTEQDPELILLRQWKHLYQALSKVVSIVIPMRWVKPWSHKPLAHPKSCRALTSIRTPSERTN